MLALVNLRLHSVVLLWKKYYHISSILTGINHLFQSSYRKLRRFQIVLYLIVLEDMDIEAESYAYWTRCEIQSAKILMNGSIIICIIHIIIE
jgi:hypothetical protein